MSQPPAMNTSPNSNSGPWATFRRLLSYYIESIQASSQFTISFMLDGNDHKEAPDNWNYHNTDIEADTWIQYPDTPKWAQLYSNTKSLPKLILQREQTGFRRDCNNKKRISGTIIGYPIFVKTIKFQNKNIQAIIPLFVQRVNSNDIVEDAPIKPIGLASLNERFITEYRWSDRNRSIKQFKNNIGIYELDDCDRDIGDIPAKPITELAQNFYRLHGDMAQEEITPNKTIQGRDLTQLKDGIYNTCIIGNFKSTSFGMNRSLIYELTRMRDVHTDNDFDKTALAHLFKTPVHEATKQQAQPLNNIASVDPLNANQETSIKQAMFKELSSITGPPGTGKSAVAKNLMLNMGLKGRNVLFASKNHCALNAVESPLLDLGRQSGLIVRTNYQDRGSNKPTQGMIFDILEHYNFSEETSASLPQLQILTAQQKENKSKLLAHHDLTNRYTELQLELVTCIEDLPTGINTRELSDYIDEELGPITNADLERMITMSGFGPIKSFINKCLHPWFAKKYNSKLKILYKHLSTSIALEALAAAKSILHIRQLKKEIEFCIRKRDALPSHSQIVSELAHCEECIHKTTRELAPFISLNGLRQTNEERADSLKRLSAALVPTEKLGFERNLNQSHRSQIQAAFPLWMTTNLSVNNSYQLRPATFDLLIIDEASQCDIASCIPLFFRSKRATVIGDPMQLSPICNMHEEVHNHLLRMHNLSGDAFDHFNYLRNSVFDLVNKTINHNNKNTLQEHFRCHPDIAHFASDTFYNSDLIIRTSPNNWDHLEIEKTGMYWEHIDGPIKESATSGVYSEDEARYIANSISQLCKSSFKGSIGVVTPFSAQADIIRKLVRKQIPDIDTRQQVNFLCATAHSFQGDERDVLFFSLSCGTKMKETSKQFVATHSNLFNVAVTRARAALFIVGNLEWAKTSGIHFIQKCVEYAHQAQHKRDIGDISKLESPMEIKLYDALTKAGIHPVPQHKVLGRSLDFAILEPHMINIEVDGEAFHKTAGGQLDDEDKYRDYQLANAGWKVLRFWAHDIEHNIEECVSLVKNATLNNSIKDKISNAIT